MNKKYRVAAADPPWATEGFTDARHIFPLMKTKDICDLPVKDLMADDSLLFLWSMSGCLYDALEVIEAWGFKYVNYAFVWLKLTKEGNPRYNMGHYTKQCAEVCLLGKRGRPKVNICSAGSVIFTQERMPFAMKPPETRDRIMTVAGHGPYLELFGRQVPPGWDVWGIDAPKCVKLGGFPHYSKPRHVLKDGKYVADDSAGVEDMVADMKALEKLMGGN